MTKRISSRFRILYPEMEGVSVHYSRVLLYRISI